MTRKLSIYNKQRRISLSEQVQKRYADMEGDILCITVTRASRSKALGVVLTGHKDPSTMCSIILGIDPKGPAGKKGLLKVGDLILEVNGHLLRDRSHLNAATIIENIPERQLRFVVLRAPENINDAALPPEATRSFKYIYPAITKRKPTEINLISGDDDEDTVSVLRSKDDNRDPEDRERLLYDPRVYTRMRQIVLPPATTGLGFTIKEREDGIIVKSVDASGPAAEEGSLRPGDRLLGVDSTPLINMSLEDAENVLASKKSAQQSVTLIINQSRGSGGPSAEEESAAREHSKRKVGFNVVTPEIAGDSAEPAGRVNLNELETKDIEVVIQRSEVPLGVTLIGGVTSVLGKILISEILPNGAAALNGHLRVGDELVEVNGVEVRNSTLAQALEALFQPGVDVKMIVSRHLANNEAALVEAMFDNDAHFDIFEIQVERKKGKGLGISISERSGFGIFVHEVMDSSIAAADGRIHKGDQLLSVNDISLRHASHKQAATLLKITSGKITLTVKRLKEKGGLKSSVSMGDLKSANKKLRRRDSLQVYHHHEI